MRSRNTILNMQASFLSHKFIAPFERTHNVFTKSISHYCTSCDKALEILKRDKCEIRPLGFNIKITSLVQHWRDGKEIAETPLPELMLERIRVNGGIYKGLTNSDDIYRYYENLDRVYEHVQRSGLDFPKNPSFVFGKFEMNGITINIDADSTLIFAGRGSHRLAMAIAASLDTVPVLFRKINSSVLKTAKWERIVLGNDFESNQEQI